MQSLVNLFDNYFSIPIEDLLTKPTIIELAAIENSDQKALIISLLLLSILAYVNSNAPKTPPVTKDKNTKKVLTITSALNMILRATKIKWSRLKRENLLSTSKTVWLE